MIRLTRGAQTSYRLLLVAPAAGLVTLIAACGGVSYGGAAATGAGASAATSVAVGTTGLGQVLTDGAGRTLYLFEKDSGSTSACDASCASVWPPLTTAGSAQAGNGASAGLVGTITRADGTKQVSYNGHPLYYYVGDQKPGDTKGQNLDQFGGGWYVLSPTGTQIGN